MEVFLTNSLRANLLDLTFGLLACYQKLVLRVLTVHLFLRVVKVVGHLCLRILEACIKLRGVVVWHQRALC